MESRKIKAEKCLQGNHVASGEEVSNIEGRPPSLAEAVCIQMQQKQQNNRTIGGSMADDSKIVTLFSRRMSPPRATSRDTWWQRQQNARATTALILNNETPRTNKHGHVVELLGLRG